MQRAHSADLHPFPSKIVVDRIASIYAFDANSWVFSGNEFSIETATIGHHLVGNPPRMTCWLVRAAAEQGGESLSPPVSMILAVVILNVDGLGNHGSWPMLTRLSSLIFHRSPAAERNEPHRLISKEGSLHPHCSSKQI
ncbi:hypothetical protein Salat_1148400 [Sesamum alatum]|uniref:Uncharacterized protein n=1 Tax=Sesamum alatum TaxID=300844 RepID=A0AAE1YF84_9LAMI|nr:hypothetical protein Salat_1148400 [Sesamum alatum]